MDEHASVGDENEHEEEEEEGSEGDDGADILIAGYNTRQEPFSYLVVSGAATGTAAPLEEDRTAASQGSELEVPYLVNPYTVVLPFEQVPFRVAGANRDRVAGHSLFVCILSSSQDQPVAATLVTVRSCNISTHHTDYVLLGLKRLREVEIRSSTVCRAVVVEDVVVPPPVRGRAMWDSHWEPWVLSLFDCERLRRLCIELLPRTAWRHVLQRQQDPPRNPFAFSFWLASAVLLDQDERCAALYCDDTSQRLRDLLLLLQRSSDEEAGKIRCAECGVQISAMQKSFTFGDVATQVLGSSGL
jgi:hypothetical protein